MHTLPSVLLSCLRHLAQRVPRPPLADLSFVPQQDKLEVFQEYIRDLEKADELRKAEEKARQKRQERRNREAFLALLEQRRAEGKLTARSVWKAFEKEIEGEEAYLLMKTNVVGSRPKARPKARAARSRPLLACASSRHIPPFPSGCAGRLPAWAGPALLEPLCTAALFSVARTSRGCQPTSDVSAAVLGSCGIDLSPEYPRPVCLPAHFPVCAGALPGRHR